MALLGFSTGEGRSAAEALDRLLHAARSAGEMAMRDFRLGGRTTAGVQFKEGGSPVTDADLRANDVLQTTLGADFPGVGWLSEETVDSADRLGKSEILIVDPIDGTRAFLTGDARWAVSVALASEGRVVAGVVHAPALRETFLAAKGKGATHNGERIAATKRAVLAGATGAGPRPMIEALAHRAGVDIVAAGRIPSLAYRLALVASGQLDFAFATANSNEWDIAAADILLSEAGARLVNAAGAPIRYNSPTTRQTALVAAPQALMAQIFAAGSDFLGISH
jgi:myo-inositol-1(or 4)-monophosphatase